METISTKEQLNEWENKQLLKACVSLNSKERHIILHTCGLSNSTSAYRNHYSADAQHHSASELEKLCKINVLEKAEGKKHGVPCIVYHLTEDGFKLARFIYRKTNDFKKWLQALKGYCRNTLTMSKKDFTEYIELNKEEFLWDCFIHNVTFCKVIEAKEIEFEIITEKQWQS